MKLISAAILIGVTLLRAEAQEVKSSFTTDFNKVADTYLENLKRYLSRFAENQYSDSERTPNLVEAAYKVYVQKAEQLEKESFETFKKRYEEKIDQVDKKQIVGYFDLLYRAQFPG